MREIQPSNTYRPVIALSKLSQENYRRVFSLEVSVAQKPFYPRSNEYSIAEASVYTDAWYRAICLDRTPVGFVMLSLVPGSAEYFIWRFMIDHRHQRKGYGAEAMRLIIEYVRMQPYARDLYASHERGNLPASDFYRKSGFRYVGADQNDDLLMALNLWEQA